MDENSTALAPVEEQTRFDVIVTKVFVKSKVVVSARTPVTTAEEDTEISEKISKAVEETVAVVTSTTTVSKKMPVALSTLAFMSLLRTTSLSFMLTSPSNTMPLRVTAREPVATAWMSTVPEPADLRSAVKVEVKTMTLPEPLASISTLPPMSMAGRVMGPVELMVRLPTEVVVMSPAEAVIPVDVLRVMSPISV